MRPAVMLAMALLAAAPSAEAAAAKAKRARPPSPAPTRAPTRATEAEVVADLIRACANEAWEVMHRAPPRAPYTREMIIQDAHRIGNVMTRQEVEGSSSTVSFDDCAYQRRAALYRGAPLLGPLERLPPVKRLPTFGRLKD